MNNPMTRAAEDARRQLAARPEPHNDLAQAEAAMRALERGARERVIDALLGSDRIFRDRYMTDAAYKAAVDAYAIVAVDAIFHGGTPDRDLERREMAVALYPPAPNDPAIEKGQLWRDSWGRTMEIIDASDEILRVQWTPGGIAPSGMSRQNLRLCYTLVGVAR